MTGLVLQYRRENRLETTASLERRVLEKLSKKQNAVMADRRVTAKLYLAGKASLQIFLDFRK